MLAKKSNQKINPWSDLTREKLSDTSGLSVKKQIGDLVSPAKMLDQIFGAKSSNEQYPKIPGREKQPAKQSQENVIFSNSHRSEDIKIRQETNAIATELKKQIAILERKEKTFTTELSKIKVEQLPAKTGIYYLRFLEWMLLEVKRLIIKVEEGSVWLATFNSRKKKKLGYWKMYKKHGTSFGLSQERSSATQTG